METEEEWVERGSRGEVGGGYQERSERKPWSGCKINDYTVLCFCRNGDRSQDAILGEKVKHR